MNRLDPHPPTAIDNERVSRETFDSLYRDVGYTYEYVDGRVRISVAESALAVVAARTDRLRRLSGDHAGPGDLTLMPAREVGRADLETAWLQAFTNAPEFYGYPITHLRERAKIQVAYVFEERELSSHPVSVVLTHREGIAGAVLVSTRTTRPVIEAAFVRRRLRRYGFGRLMLQRVGAHLHAGGIAVLCSHYHLANRASAEWHAALGFEEMPDWMLAARRHRCAVYNLRQGWSRDVMATRRHVEALRQRKISLRAASKEDELAASPHEWLQSRGDRIDAFADRIGGDPR